MPVGPSGTRIDVEKLSSAPLREDYQQQVNKEWERPAWPEDMGEEQQWKSVSFTLISSDEDLLGMVECFKPNWYHHSLEESKPLSMLKNDTHALQMTDDLRLEELNKLKKGRCNVRQIVRRVEKSGFKRMLNNLRGRGLKGRIKVCNCIWDI